MDVKIDAQDDALVQAIANKLVEQIAPAIQQIVINNLSQEHGMTEREIAREVLKCDPGMMDYYLQQPGFPFYYKGKQKMYWPPAVKEWLDKNQQSLV